MRLWLERDEANDLWTIRQDNCVIDSLDRVQEWRKKLAEALKAKGPGKVALLVDMERLSIDPNMASEYGETARSVATEHAHCIVRYGLPGGMTTATIRLQSVIQRYPSNVFENREAAIEAVRRIRGL